MAPAPGGKAPGINDTGKKKGFRETAWFKRGEIEEEMARAQAAGGTGKHGVVDENAVDLSSQDRARLSLRTGATQAMPAIGGKAGGLPGERMDEAEMLAEISSSRKYFIIAGAVVVAIVIGLVLFFATRGGSSPKAEAPPADKPAPVAASPPSPTAPPPAAIAAAAVPTPPATPSAPPPSTAPQVSPAPATPTSGLASDVEKVEAAPTVRELRRVERAVTQDLKVAHKKRDRAAEAADRQLLVRLKKASRRVR